MLQERKSHAWGINPILKMAWGEGLPHSILRVNRGCHLTRSATE